MSGADLTFDSNVNDATYNEYSIDGKGQEYASLAILLEQTIILKKSTYFNFLTN